LGRPGHEGGATNHASRYTLRRQYPHEPMTVALRVEEMDKWHIPGQKKACVVDVTRRTYEKHRCDGRTQIDAVPACGRPRMGYDSTGADDYNSDTNLSIF